MNNFEPDVDCLDWKDFFAVFSQSETRRKHNTFTVKTNFKRPHLLRYDFKVFRF